MLIPRFSLRWLLALTTVCAGLSLLVSLAIQGRAWAIGTVAAMGTLAALVVLYISTFLAAWLASNLYQILTGNRPGTVGVSPFKQMEPQMVPAAEGGAASANDNSPVSG